MPKIYTACISKIWIYPDGVQLLGIPPDDLISTALLAPPPRPSAPEEDDEFSRFFKISRFKFSRLLLPLLVAHVSDLALLLDALKGIPPPFPPPPIPEPLLDRRGCPGGGLASTGGLIGSCLALITSWLLTYLALSASSLSTALRRFGLGSTLDNRLKTAHVNDYNTPLKQFSIHISHNVYYSSLYIPGRRKHNTERVAWSNQNRMHTISGLKLVNRPTTDNHTWNLF